MADVTRIDMFEGLGDSIYVLAVKALSSGRPIKQTFPVFYGLLTTVVVQVTLLVLLLIGAGGYPKMAPDTSGQVQEVQQQLCWFLNSTNITQASSNMSTFCKTTFTQNPSASSVSAVVLVYFVTACALFTLSLFATHEAANACCLGHLVEAYGGFMFDLADLDEHPAASAFAYAETVLHTSIIRCRLAALLPVPQLMISVLAYISGVLLMTQLQFSTDLVQIVVNSVAIAFILELDDKVGQTVMVSGHLDLSNTAQASPVSIKRATGIDARRGLVYSSILYALVLGLAGVVLTSPSLIVSRSNILDNAPGAHNAMLAINIGMNVFHASFTFLVLLSNNFVAGRLPVIMLGIAAGWICNGLLVPVKMFHSEASRLALMSPEGNHNDQWTHIADWDLHILPLTLTPLLLLFGFLGWLLVSQRRTS